MFKLLRSVHMSAAMFASRLALCQRNAKVNVNTGNVHAMLKLMLTLTQTRTQTQVFGVNRL